MNSNKKDVNDYFKWIRRYYLELMKKKKKEIEEIKKKNEEIEIIRKKKQQEYENVINNQIESKKTKVENSRKKVVEKKEIKKKTTLKEETTKINNPTINKTRAINIELERKRKLEEQKKKDLENIKKLNEKKKLEEDKKKNEEKKKLEEEKKKQQERAKKLDEEKKKKQEELKKEQEKKKKLEEEKIKQENEKKKVEDQKKKNEQKNKTKEEKENNNEVNKDNLKNNANNKNINKQVNNEEKKKDRTKKENEKEQNKKTDNKENNNVAKQGNKEKDSKEKDSKVKNDKEQKDLENNKESKTNNDKTKEENKKEKDETNDKKDKKEIDDKNKSKEQNKTTEEKNEKVTKKSEKEIELENIEKIGLANFIKTINKKIKDDYKSLNDLDMENHRITQELENAREVSDINKLIDRLKGNQNKIDAIINRINDIENGNIISDVYEYSKEKPKELKEFIKILEKEKNNTRYIDTIYKPNFKDKLDYTDRINRIKINTNKKEQELISKKDSFENLNDKEQENDNQIEKFNKKRYHFEDLALKFQISISNFENKVNNISVKEEVIKKYFLNGIEIKNNLQLKRIAMSMYNEENGKSIEQIYNELQSKLYIVASSKLVPSNNYKTQLLNEKQGLLNTKLELKTTLKEIKEFKDEFIREFSDYYDTNEYLSYLDQIEKIEGRLSNQNDKLNLLNNKIDTTIIKNDKKVEEIDKMNIGRNNVKVINDPNNQNMQNQNNQTFQNRYGMSYEQYINNLTQSNINKDEEKKGKSR